jgi:uncharacterized membrane protein YccF (DUF307 family)
MNLLGNIVFFVFGGFVIFFGYVLGGILLCLTIVGIPLGFQCFKLAGGVLAPFGREVYEVDPPPGVIVLNVIWIVLSEAKKVPDLKSGTFFTVPLLFTLRILF